jgi:hypothetical protein
VLRSSLVEKIGDIVLGGCAGRPILPGISRRSWLTTGVRFLTPSADGTTPEAWTAGVDLFFSRLFAGVFAFAAAIGGAGAQTAGPVERFDYVLGTQTFGPAYRFTAAAPLVETARVIGALGSNAVKFQLKSSIGSGQTMADIARNDPAIRTVLDMPFVYTLMWAYPAKTKARLFDPGTLDIKYNEVYDLTRYLRETYGGRGKVFLLGNWEMDNHLTESRKKEPSPELLTNITAWVDRRQQAVDDAKRDTAASDVEVYYYLEVNLVWDAIAGRPRAANIVLPASRVDYVSYSAYDSLLPDPEQKLPQALDYLQSKLQPKDGLSAKRVFIGEYGFPADHFSPQKQDALSRRVMRTGLAWGCPFVLYWEVYNNAVKDGRQRGFWLIDDKGHEQPVYFTLQQFFGRARSWVSDFLSERQRLPTSTEFGQIAAQWLE